MFLGNEVKRDFAEITVFTAAWFCSCIRAAFWLLLISFQLFFTSIFAIDNIGGLNAGSSC